MGKIANIFIDIINMEKLAERDSFAHSLDPRCKIVVTLFFTVTVVSFNRYEISALIPFFAFPLFLMIASDIPPSFLLKKLFFVSFFAIMVGLANPFLDRTPRIYIASYPISGGIISYLSIILRFLLTAGAALLLITTTGMYNISRGLEKLRIPHIFVMQMFFLCRYIFVLTEEAARLTRARESRTFGKKGSSIAVFSNMLSTLFMRSLDRAERLYTAMKSRGFDGSIKMMGKLRWKSQDTFFTIFWILLFIFFRFQAGAFFQ